VILLALALAASPAQQWQYYGFPGNDSCGDWTAERKDPNRRGQTLQGWVLGYVSGRNRYAVGIDTHLGAGTSATSLLAWIDQYCTANPLDPISRAAHGLVAELERRRAKR